MGRQPRSKSRNPSAARGRAKAPARSRRRGAAGTPWWAAPAGAVVIAALVIGALVFVGMSIGDRAPSPPPVASEAADAGRSLEVVIDSTLPVRRPDPPAAIPV